MFCGAGELSVLSGVVPGDGAAVRCRGACLLPDDESCSLSGDAGVRQKRGQIYLGVVSGYLFERCAWGGEM